ncbi:MAG: hypothetical protein PQJ46_15530, partial [Spirochaetales bacterium]|nr:hypothetical protein [Spirochaetales bacterium]
QSQLLNLQMEKHSDLLSELEAKIDSFESVPDCSDASFGDYLLIRGAIFREKSAISWLEECLNLLGRD